MFKINGNKGFHITFSNGITISTQLGGGNYCANYDDTIGDGQPKECVNAEIALWDKDGKWITRKIVKKALGEKIGNDVYGYVTIDKWQKIIKAAQAV